MKQRRFFCLIFTLIMLIGLLPLEAGAAEAVSVEYNGYTLIANGYNSYTYNYIKELKIFGFEVRDDSSIYIDARIAFRYGSSRVGITFSPDTNCMINYEAIGKKNSYDKLSITLYRSAKDHTDENNDYRCDVCKQYSFSDFKVAFFDKAISTATVLIPTAGTYTVLFADYDENNALSKYETKTITTTEAEIVYVTTTNEISLQAGDKIMLWNNVTQLKPCCDALIIDHTDENNDYMCDYCEHYSFSNFEIVNFNKTTSTATILIPKAGTYSILWVDYGENNDFLNTEIQTITTTGAEVVPISITKEFTLESGDKIMLWSNMTQLMPICNTLVID